MIDEEGSVSHVQKKMLLLLRRDASVKNGAAANALLTPASNGGSKFCGLK